LLCRQYKAQGNSVKAERKSELSTFSF